MRICDVHGRIKTEIFDYQTLIYALGDLAFPRNKISDMLRQGLIVRVKKGLYVFGEEFRRHPYSKELLANLIYGPSYVSLDYALAYHGLIPESVEALTSVTTGRPRRFDTPAGLFLFRQIPLRAYETGMVRVEAGNDQAFLIASPEKALADKVVSVRGVHIGSMAEMGRFLEEDLRIDGGALRSMSAESIDEFAGRYRSRRLKHLSGLIRKLAIPRKGVPHE